MEDNTEIQADETRAKAEDVWQRIRATGDADLMSMYGELLALVAVAPSAGSSWEHARGSADKIRAVDLERIDWRQRAERAEAELKHLRAVDTEMNDPTGAAIVEANEAMGNALIERDATIAELEDRLNRYQADGTDYDKILRDNDRLREAIARVREARESMVRVRDAGRAPGIETGTANGLSYAIKKLDAALYGTSGETR